MDTYDLKCGIQLCLQSVNQVVVSGIQSKMISRLLGDPNKAKRVMEFIEGDADVTNEQVMELFGDDVAFMAGAGEQLFTYCAGWGVSNDPPADAEEIIELFGIASNKPHLRRAAWVRSLMEDQAEANGLVTRVIALTQRQDGSGGTGA